MSARLAQRRVEEFSHTQREMRASAEPIFLPYAVCHSNAGMREVVENSVQSPRFFSFVIYAESLYGELPPISPGEIECGSTDGPSL